jgi:hypothetical protein
LLLAVLAGAGTGALNQALLPQGLLGLPILAGEAEVEAVEILRLAQAVRAWLSFVAQEQQLHSQAHLQLQLSVVTTYIHSLATDQ